MPALADQEIILPAIGKPNPRRAFVSPSREHLSLEQITGRQVRYLGRIVGVDMPIMLAPTGWGEYVPLNTGPAQL